MRRKRRGVEAVSLSFLDCICCGFGAVILMLVLVKTTQPQVLEATTIDLKGKIANLQEQIVEIRGEKSQANRRLVTERDQISIERRNLARLLGDAEKIAGEFATTRQDSRVANVLSGRLASARQDLTDEMKRLLGADFKRDEEQLEIGGIPVDSEYIVFIIDTSGSMFNYAWPKVVEKLEQTLNIYPQVKGIQVMNDMGKYMFPRYAGRWMPDNPARRSAILRRLKSWNEFSNSSPVEGITRAIGTFYSPDKRVSLYVFGDEFTGGSIERVLDTVDRVNRLDSEGNKRVRIHAVGFPSMFLQAPRLQGTGIRFATLMRELCSRNGGTFVALDDLK